MGEFDGGRRQLLLRLLALSAAVGSRLDWASAQPAGTRAAPAARVPTVVVDPGHGGADPGAISQNGIYEKLLSS